MRARLTLTALPGEYAVGRLAPDAAIPGWVPASGVVSVTRTPTELSVVCVAAALPGDVGPEQLLERGWRMIRFEGPFAFTETGILVAVLEPLAVAGIGIFAISTYDTDYVMVAGSDLDAALEVLEAAGHTVLR